MHPVAPTLSQKHTPNCTPYVNAQTGLRTAARLHCAHPAIFSNFTIQSKTKTKPPQIINTLVSLCDCEQVTWALKVKPGIQREHVISIHRRSNECGKNPADCWVKGLVSFCHPLRLTH